MEGQLEFFRVPSNLPEGFRYEPAIMSKEAEVSLLDEIRRLPFQEFEFHGYKGKRRTVSFGASYDFERERLEDAPEMPKFLRELREAAASFAELSPRELHQVLVTEYAPGAGIGWHKDKSVFRDVVGISLLSPCQFRLRRPRGDDWDRITIEAEPRSAYLLRGPVRTEWEHSIPPVAALRYSVTYRSRTA